MVTVPRRVPVAAGSNVTAMLQLEPVESVLPQVVVCPKSPLGAMPEILSDPIPLLVRVTVCAGDVVPTDCAPKSTWVLLRVALGTACVPLPASGMATGSCRALLLMVAVAVSGPSTCGWNATLIWQALPGDTALTRQAVPSTPKSFVSSTLMLLIDTGSSPLLASWMTVCPVVPTVREPKSTLLA